MNIINIFFIKFFSNKEMNNSKSINTIIKDLSISPQKKLYIYLDSKYTIQE